jgi:hypothetical protein
MKRLFADDARGRCLPYVMALDRVLLFQFIYYNKQDGFEGAVHAPSGSYPFTDQKEKSCFQ